MSIEIRDPWPAVPGQLRIFEANSVNALERRPARVLVDDGGGVRKPPLSMRKTCADCRSVSDIRRIKLSPQSSLSFRKWSCFLPKPSCK